MIYNYSGPGVETIFPKIGAFIIRGENPDEYVTYGASTKLMDDGLTYVVLHFQGGEERYLPVMDDLLTINENTGTIEFRSTTVDYTIREFREEDGYWISSLRMPLPVSVMENMLDSLNKGILMDDMQDEKLIAYAFDDSLYVVGLVYLNSMGRWVRSEGDWVLMGVDDDTFKDAVVMEIDPEKADEYVDLYDANYVPVSDTEDFELVEDEEPVPANTPVEAEEVEK
jgi:hypothetical protein